MKSLRATFLCCNYKLYKVGLIIGFIYLIPNLMFVVYAFGNGTNTSIYHLPILCTVTVLTSLLLIKGLIEEKHHLLMPWMANIGVLIIFNIILFMFQSFREEAKKSFYLQLAFFICLELQILFWYVIYCLLIRGYQKSKMQTGRIKSISQIVANQKDYFKANANFIGDKKIQFV